MTGPCRIGVVVLDFNQAALTRRCLNSIAAGSVAVEVVLVENGMPTGITSDDYGGLLKLIVLHPGTNAGCAGGRNIGVDFLVVHTASNCIVILDNDAVVPTSFFELLSASPPRVNEVLAPLIYWYGRNTIWSSGGSIQVDGSIQQHADNLWVDSVLVDWAPGACLIFAPETWRTVGCFDAWLNFLFEDIDWCLRVRRGGGTVKVCAELTIEHEAHQTWGGPEGAVRTWFWARNGTVFRARLGISLGDMLRWLLSEMSDLGRDLLAFRGNHVFLRTAGLCAGLFEAMRRGLRLVTRG